MAPMNENNQKDCAFDRETDSSSVNIWERILSEVQSSSTYKLPSDKSLVVLGDNESGKTTLIARLEANEDPKKGSGLEYTYINVKDEYREDQTRLGVWVLDGDLHHRRLLRYALPANSLRNSVILLVVSIAQPWSLMENLEKWIKVLSNHLEGLKITAGEMDELKAVRVQDFQEYTEPETTLVTTTPRRPTSKGEDDKVVLPLEEGTLTTNLGVPIIVVVTKSDAISTLEKEYDYKEEHFDFIQQYIRKFCLQYGAALFYTSVKEDKNCELLYRYVLHKVYGFPFKTPAFVVERDAVFVPLGWDTEKKISILYDGMTNIKPDYVYEDVITKPVLRRPVQKDMEVSAEDEQVFLMKQQAHLSKQPSVQRESPNRPAARQSPAVPSQSPTTPTRPQPGDGTPKAAVGQEGVLANFFNSLLNKKTGASGGATPVARTSIARGDAQAELERITRKKPSTMSSGASSNNTPKPNSTS